MRRSLVFTLLFLSLFSLHSTASLTATPGTDLERQISSDPLSTQYAVNSISKNAIIPLPDSDPEPWHLERPRDVLSLRHEDDDTQVQHVLQLLDEFPDRGPNLLHHAAIRGTPNIMLALLARGVDPSSKADVWGHGHVIHTAASNGCLECVKVLVTEVGVDPDLVDECSHFDCRSPGWTPFVIAVGWDYRDVVEWLLDTGRVNTTRELPGYGMNALQYAVAYHPHLADLLLDHPQAREDRRVLGVTEAEYLGPRILALAATGGDVELFRRLLSELGYPTSSDDSSAWRSHLLADAQREKLQEAFHGAAQGAHGDIARLLLEDYFHAPGDLASFFSDSRMAWSLEEGTERAIGNNDTETFSMLLSLLQHSGELKSYSRRRYNQHLWDCLTSATVEKATGIVRLLVEEYKVKDPDLGEFVVSSVYTFPWFKTMAQVLLLGSCCYPALAFLFSHLGVWRPPSFSWLVVSLVAFLLVRVSSG